MILFLSMIVSIQVLGQTTERYDHLVPVRGVYGSSKYTLDEKTYVHKVLLDPETEDIESNLKILKFPVKHPQSLLEFRVDGLFVSQNEKSNVLIRYHVPSERIPTHKKFVKNEEGFLKEKKITKTQYEVEIPYNDYRIFSELIYSALANIKIPNNYVVNSDLNDEYFFIGIHVGKINQNYAGLMMGELIEITNSIIDLTNSAEKQKPFSSNLRERIKELTQQLKSARK